ncbi:MAG: tetratricopeptide repeat protein [Verrucomicrobia bacterium]|nr:tetratricopeptide repeat protein [Verrucomicrobiota bacterium]
MTAPSNAPRPGPKPSRNAADGYRIFFFVVVMVFVILNAWLWRLASRRDAAKAMPPPTAAAPYDPEADATVLARYGGSRSCQECHETEYALWQTSHHALAERALDPAREKPAFEPPQVFQHGKQRSEARLRDGRYELATLGLNGHQPFPLVRALGVDPMRQFLVAEPRGRYQMTELAADSRTNDWFDVYAEEDRQPGEWGHWTGRGMTWNTMCAFCHNTRVRKNYEFSTDSYATVMKEHGVGCEACHGPMADHNAWQQQRGGKQKGDPTARRFDNTLMLDYCGACHARRNDLTGDFHPGERFFDHYLLTLPDDSDTYYPDGQVRDEDFEFTAFLGSRMQAAGVTCKDCHDPHSGKRLLAGNALCMKCHEKPPLEFPTAKPIDPAQHSFHTPNTPGDLCTDCHMPQTVYMARHWRHDHGWTIPDPLLTLQHQIPNACSRCHQDKSVEWNLKYCEEWYGDQMNRPTRRRAQAVAKARAGLPDAHLELLRLLPHEDIPLWRAATAALLKFWTTQTNVAAALLRCAQDPHPLVRSVAAQSLEFVPADLFPDTQAALERLLTDPFRAVRIRAAWALRRKIAPDHLAAIDLQRSMDQSRDHPSGLLQLGIWHLDRGDVETAFTFLQRAVQWDGRSSPLRQALAVAYSLRREPAKAVAELQTACRLAPQDAECRYKLGLALNETGDLAGATAALQETVKLNPGYARAWYNLGLALAAQEMLNPALDAFLKAEQLEPASAQIAYAMATVHARLGHVQAARAAAHRALDMQPTHSEAARLLEALPE